MGLRVNEKEAKELLSINLEKDLKSAVEGSDCIALISAHPEFKNVSFEEISNLTSPNCTIVDGRSAFDREEVKKEGFDYWRIGLGRSRN
ncbi:hypothetical protein AKJ37_07285 [candidate division MSBL1 archaeon SCGC-AAA259I09]|uniref:UDP-glucose/GDP-mannose dehydrogenase C-terminal domain-containing protein n=1 Tax=candidate division MSBL1 archaeon SCGC-AAA259I09 TaxID=1698267 RepID=A0A133UKT0_9EURY|nr:hypothetical protein AKJ37_07285 [candidate division MSBL1 archaeon SCGC-AAA259I09]